MSDSYEIDGTLAGRKGRYALNLTIAESPDKDSLQPESNSLKQQVLRCMPCFHIALLAALRTCLPCAGTREQLQTVTSIQVSTRRLAPVVAEPYAIALKAIRCLEDVLMARLPRYVASVMAAITTAHLVGGLHPLAQEATISFFVRHIALTKRLAHLCPQAQQRLPAPPARWLQHVLCGVLPVNPSVVSITGSTALSCLADNRCQFRSSGRMIFSKRHILAVIAAPKDRPFSKIIPEVHA